MSERKNLRAGLIGLGMMGRNHARVLRSLEGVDLVAVADPAGDAHGAAPGYEILGSAQELVKQGLDYAVVAVPTALHHDVALTFAEAGVNVLVEKPLAFDIAEATEIAGAFEKAGLLGAVGYIERYNPALQEMRKRLEQGELGDVYQVATRRQGIFPARIADVGVVKDLATHDLDLTSWVAQSPFAQVAAFTTARSGRDTEDMVSATGRLESGTITSHLVNWLSPFKERRTVVTGEKGAFVGDTLTADLTFYANGVATTNEWDAIASFRGVSEGDKIQYALTKREPLQTEHAAYRDALLGLPGADAKIVTMRQALHTVTVVEAVLASARDATVESIPDPGK